MSIEKIEVTESFKLIKSSNILYVDLDLITSPLTLRKWEQGDWFIPLGMKGKKKLSDYFSDNKFSLFDKENVWILCAGSDLVWLAGHRPDDRFKITSKTKKALKIQLHQ